MDELVKFLGARWAEEEATTVIPRAFSADVWINAPNRAHLLADLKSKRAILNNHTHRFVVGGEGHDAQTLRHLAEPYADHPDYQEAWRP